MAVSSAWLLTFSDQFRAAIGTLEMVHIIPKAPKLIERSSLPDYSRNYFVWHEQQLQLMDINLFLIDKSDRSKIMLPDKDALIGIVSYILPDENTQKYGALLMARLPVRIKVDDKQACALPSYPQGWKKLGISCFQHPEFGPVPILDLARIFSTISSQIM